MNFKMIAIDIVKHPQEVMKNRYTCYNEEVVKVVEILCYNVKTGLLEVLVECEE